MKHKQKNPLIPNVRWHFDDGTSMVEGPMNEHYENIISKERRLAELREEADKQERKKYSDAANSNKSKKQEALKNKIIKLWQSEPRKRGEAKGFSFRISQEQWCTVDAVTIEKTYLKGLKRPTN